MGYGVEDRDDLKIKHVKVKWKPTIVKIIEE